MRTFDELVERLKEAKSLGWVNTHRPGDTGIGKTVEDLLGIKENNAPGPDGQDVELKSCRKSSKSMLTLFTKAPLPRGANSVILEGYGYPVSDEDPKKELHTTVNAETFNTLRGHTGLKLKLGDGRVSIIDHNSTVIGYWDEGTLKKCFEKKFPRLLLIKADNRGEGKREEFRVQEAWFLMGFHFTKFLEMIGRKIIVVDIRLGHYPNGRPHDHGTAFRMMLNKLDLCFERRKSVL